MNLIVMENAPSHLLVLYASQTGNALDVAERVIREAGRLGCPATILSIDDFSVSSLPFEDTIIFVVSTTGQGDTPDSMKGFWKFLLQRNLGPQWLQGVQYTVFGLGDSGYQKFNFTAKKLDKRLSDLGAKPIVEKGLGDDQHPSGYEGALDPWLSNLWKALKQMKPTMFPCSLERLNTKSLDNPKYQITYHEANGIQSPNVSSADLKSLELIIGRARSMSPGILQRDNNWPNFFLHMTENRTLTKVGCGKDVRHLEFEPLSSDIEYQVGDYIEILPSQDPSAVNAFLERCNLNPDSYITIQQNEIGFPSKESREPVTFRDYVEKTMDISSASPRRYFFEVMSFFASADHEKEKLEYFASAQGRDDLYNYNQKERRTVLEVLEDFPSVQMPFEWLVQLVPPLRTRAFSISSSLSAHPNQVHLTVDVVSWLTPLKRKRSGLCSTWLAGLDPHKGEPIPVWINRATLPPPPPSLPLILVGPGTGCAPFRAFVEERALQRDSGPTAPTLFFFGCRNESNDFLYQDFWLAHANSFGVLSEETGGGFFVAFSRDQPEKIYVQHKMKEERKRIWALLCAGAAIYVAGSATKMPTDVLSAMEEIVSTESGLPREAASRWLKELEKKGKYNVETWS